MSELLASFELWAPGVAAMAGLICASGFFSASETAFFFLSREEIRAMSHGNSRDRIVAALMNDPDRLLTAILFWNLLINLAYFAIGLVVISRLTQEGFGAMAAVVAIGNLVGMIVFGEVLPKSSAVAFGTFLAPLVSWPLAAAVRVLDPFIPLLSRTAVLLRLAFWPHIEHEPPLNPEDLERAVDTTAAGDLGLLPQEQRVLHNVLDLNEIRVEELMRPRGHCLVCSPSTTPEQIQGNLNEAEYILLQPTDEDCPTAGVLISDKHLEAGRPLSVYSEPVLYVPWCADAAWLLATLHSHLSGVAVIVHEHGEMVGALSYEEVLETLFAENASRTQRVLRRNPLIEIAPGRFHADGLVTLRFLANRLRTDFAPPEQGLYTVAGLLQHRLGRLPVRGDSIHWLGWRMQVITTSDRGQMRVLLEPERIAARDSEDEQ